MQKYINHATPTPYGLAIPETCIACKLRDHRFFCSLPLPVLRDFNKLKASTLLPKSAVLFVEGQAPQGIYILCQGKVKLSTIDHRGNPVIVKFAHPGEVLGLTACVSGQPYALTAETHTACHTSFVKRQDFLRFLRQHGDACFQAARYAAGRHRDVVGAIQAIGHGHVANEKFAKFLLGLDENATNQVTITMTHKEIAETLGISRETVTRAFADFKSAGWIVVDGKIVTICKRTALQRLLAA